MWAGIIVITTIACYALEVWYLTSFVFPPPLHPVPPSRNLELEVLEALSQDAWRRNRDTWLATDQR